MKQSLQFIYKMEQEVEQKEKRGKRFLIYGIVLILILGISVVAALYSTGTYKEIGLLNMVRDSISSYSSDLTPIDSPEIKYPNDWESKNITDRLNYFILVQQALKKEHNEYADSLRGKEWTEEKLAEFREWQNNDWRPRNSAIGKEYAILRYSLPEPKPKLNTKVKYDRISVIENLDEQDLTNFDITEAFK